jgi:uracil-DNA glycosylase family 4
MHDATKWIEYERKPVPVPKERRKRGRPRQEIKVDSPLFAFPGKTKAEKLNQLYDRWFSCERCELGKLRCAEERGEDIVFFDGNPEADVLLIGEAPGEQEEVEGRPFVGQSGMLLNQIIGDTTDDPEIRELFNWYQKVARNAANSRTFHTKMFAYREKEFGITNVVSCRPPDNRTPTMPEVKDCWERLWNIIYIVDPLLIVTFGNTALSVVTRKTTAQITRVRGQIFDATYDGMVGELTYPIMPLLHPSFLMRSADYNMADGFYTKTVKDFRSALQIVDFLRNRYYGTPVPRR